ncbi:hypothetical protein [Dysgonomonas sp. ZJ279]|uniref:hypothetical protein n=1 Tax=Dysgonomonas sp. ZJ279 TaxID=2709796 RepID=UPI0013EBDD7E|nr:hypothetical protein [Dysgonomonas sp. ZJ279]
MKNFKYLIFVFSLFLLSCGSDDGKSSVMRWTGENNISDFKRYVGTPDGGREFVIEGVDGNGNPINVDSVKNAEVRRRFNDSYKDGLFTYMTVEFNNDIITYVDSMKIVSTYQFKNDSLFVLRSDKKLIYVATGNTDSLYRVEGLLYYQLSDKEPQIISSDKSVDLETALKSAGYSSLQEMKNPLDTIIWCNVKYIFK